MKETQLHGKDEVVNVRQREVKRTKKHMGRLVPGDGHKLYELNLSTMLMCEVVPEKKDASYTKAHKGENAGGKKLDMKENCIYTCALNEKNAIKHFNKQLPGGTLARK